MQLADLRRFASDPAEFRAALIVDTENGPQPFRPDPWQDEDFRAMDPAWLAITGHNVKPSMTRAYLERPRGHSKTGDQAIMATWALAFSRLQLCGVAAAADQAQAKLIRDAIERLMRLNPWLGARLQVNRLEVICKKTGSVLEIVSSSAPTAFGKTPAFSLLDELCHWQSRDFFDAMMSATAKRSNSVVVCISNAGVGMGESWQWNVREAFRTTRNVYFRRLEGCVASWIDRAFLEFQKKVLTPKAFNRLFGNEWQIESGDAIEEADLQAAITLDGPQDKPIPDMQYLAGVDLATRRDHSAVIILGVKNGRIHLVAGRRWKPRSGGMIDLREVLQYLVRMHRRFFLTNTAIDPYQAVLLSQMAAERGLRITEAPFSASSLNRMAETLIEALRSRILHLYDDDLGIVRDLRRMRIVDSGMRYKLVCERDPHDGHADAGFALAAVLPHAVQLARSYGFQPPTSFTVPVRNLPSGIAPVTRDSTHGVFSVRGDNSPWG